MDIEAPPVSAPLVRSKATIALSNEGTASAVCSQTQLYCREAVPRHLLYSTLPLIAALSTLSTAISVMLAVSREEPLPIRVLAPALVSTPIFLALLGFQWYFNGRRADGLVDARVLLPGEEGQQAPGLLAIALLASLSNIFDALMYAHGDRPQHDVLFGLMLTVLGLGKWLTWCLTDLQAAWRKIPNVQPLSEQSWAKPFYNNAYRLNILLRELYPAVTGIVYAQAFFKQMQSVSAFPLVNLLLALLVYQGAALSARNFDIRQNQDCSLGDNAFAIQGALAGSSRLWLRIPGRALNGQLLDDAMQKLGCSAKLRTAVVLALNGAGLVSVLQKMLTAYLVSNNPEAIAKFQEAFVLRYYASEATTLAVSARMTPAVLPMTLTLASVQAYVRSATIHDQITKDQHQPRVIQVVAAAPPPV